MPIRPDPVGLQYRPDIDGLRACAVLGVVCFHAFPNRLQGGFVGVDVFFVISGYLITTIVLQDLGRDSFSIARFYERRVRRIFPALIAVLAAVMACGWYLQVADEFQELGRHIGASALFVQNFALWNESGYFDRAARLKPLLHLWSLAIEEQFYIFWPLLLAAWGRRSWNPLQLIGAVLVFSFAGGLYLAHTNATAAYYSPVARSWELAMGAGLAWVALHRPAVLERGVELRSIAGWVFVAAGFLLISKDRQFPGWWALLPTIGAALIISAGSSAWLNRRLLASPPMVWVGLISYPLYLWHWPIFSYLQLAGLWHTKAKLAAIAGSFVAAWLTYALLEKPLRQGTKPVVAGLVLASLLLAGCGLLAYSGIVGPRNDVDLRLLRARGDWAYPGKLESLPGAPVRTYQAKGHSDQVTLFIGDSHVEQFAPRVVGLLGRERSGFNTAWFVTDVRCPSMLDLAQDGPKGRHCASMRKFVLDLARDPRVRKVVIGGFWNDYLKRPSSSEEASEDHSREPTPGTVGPGDSRRPDAALEQLRSLLAELAREKAVYLLLDIPSGQAFSPDSYIGGSRLSQMYTQPMPRFVPRSEAEEAIAQRLRQVSLQAGALVIDPVSRLCGPEGCIASTADGKPVYKDEHHLRPFLVEAKADFIDAALRTAESSGR